MAQHRAAVGNRPGCAPQLAAEIANGVAENFIATGLQRKYEASTYARTFLQQQIAKTRRDLERSEREMVAYAQAQGIINTSKAQGSQPNSDANSLQGESLIALNAALSDATDYVDPRTGADEAVEVGVGGDPADVRLGCDADHVAERAAGHEQGHQLPLVEAMATLLAPLGERELIQRHAELVKRKNISLD